MADDGRTHEQRLGEDAAELLGRLTRLRAEFFHIGTTLAVLSHHGSVPELGEAAEAARLLAGQQLAERVRDVAASLPLRGLEYGREP